MAATTPLATLVFRLQIVGAAADAQLAERLAVLDLKPKHVSLLSALRLGTPGSQADLAVVLNVAPSLVVSMADHLEDLGAVMRTRDRTDRRRQQLSLTTEGNQLLDRAFVIADGLDRELLDHLRPEQRAHARAVLARLVQLSGVPLEEDGPSS